MTQPRMERSLGFAALCRVDASCDIAVASSAKRWPASAPSCRQLVAWA